MTPRDLQLELARLGHYRGEIDGLFGRVSKAALIAAMAAGPDTPITPADLDRGALTLGVDEAAIRAVWQTEAAGAGFSAGMPKILPEPHIFSRLTAGRFDASHPGCSYPRWDKSRYPKTQAGRYVQLAEMVALDPDAGFSAASYGAFQILGANYKACAYRSPWEMAYDLSLTEGDQLDAFIAFVVSKGLDRALRARDWATFARGYNGTAYAQNAYDRRLEAAYQAALA